MMRILLFLATNFAVMLVLGIILNVTGIAGNSTGGIFNYGDAFWFCWIIDFIILIKNHGIAFCGGGSDYRTS